MPNLKTSINGLNFIGAWEGFKSMPYFATDAERKRGIRTIGFGHVIKTGENFGTNITKAQALDLLAKDVASAEAAVNKWAHPSITQPQFDALVDHVFNNGSASIQPDKIAADFDDQVRNGNWPEVAARLLTFCNQRDASGKLVKVTGLVRRTIARKALFEGAAWQAAEAQGRDWSMVNDILRG